MRRRGRLRHGLAAALAAAGLAGGALPAWAGGDMWGPGPASGPRPPLQSEPPDFRRAGSFRPSAGVAFFGGLLGFYRTVVSPVDGDRCDMAPTCSLYSRQALAEHGVLLGIVLTADRLLHEADEIPRVPEVQVGGQTFHYDPLEHNTYWWREP